MWSDCILQVSEILFQPPKRPMSDTVKFPGVLTYSKLSYLFILIKNPILKMHLGPIYTRPALS